MNFLTVLALGLSIITLAGCGRSDSASFVVDSNYGGFSLGANSALTFEREKAYAWSDWELRIVVRGDPDCQRRHTLLTTDHAVLDVRVYAPEKNVYIIEAGRHWYVTDLKSCRLQSFKEPPPVPGPMLGTLKGNDGELKFVPIVQAAE